MISIKKLKLTLNKKNLYHLLILSFFLFFIFLLQNKKTIKWHSEQNIKFGNKNHLNSDKLEKTNISYYKNCYLSLDNSALGIIHLIFTRFLIEFYNQNGFPKKLNSKYYIQNGIRVMKKYLLPSLENQSCKNFTWVLILGNQANITYVKYLLDFKNSFESMIIYKKDLKKYVRNITKGFNILITTRIDYDDRIYYDAVNDIRKSINIKRPIILHGYNRGVYYFENDRNYYDFFRDYKKKGAMSIFLSLVIILNKVNDTYIIFDLDGHTTCRETLLKKYKSFGIKELNYEPAIFDSGDPKFIYVRQNYSCSNKLSQSKYFRKMPKVKSFNLSNFFGFY